ncbi:MAG: DUF4224 domain-containing protein [Acidiferrobacteraceae bacterium]
MFLTATELQELTGRKRWNAQLRWLNMNGVPALVRADGRPMVLRATVEARMGLIAASGPTKAVEPNWSALAKTKTT